MGKLQGCRGATQGGGLTPLTLALRCGKCSWERPAGCGEGWASAEEKAGEEETAGRRRPSQRKGGTGSGDGRGNPGVELDHGRSPGGCASDLAEGKHQVQGNS